MGRIAEALRRAQRERARRFEGHPGASAGLANGAPTGAAHADNRFGAASDSTDILGQSSILGVRPSAEPLVVHAPPILPAAVDPRVVALHDPTGQIAEKYRSIRTRLLTSNPGGSSRVFAVTSSLPKEGKTVTASNLGFSLAELRHLRVALIDLDFRQRGLSRQFQADDQPGMAEVLRGDKRLAEVCVPAVRENLYFVPAGDRGEATPSELLAGASVAGILRELNERFHYSLIDTPAVNSAADMGLIGPLCHSVLIVIRMNRTPQSLLCRCVKMLQANHVSIAGCILAGHRESTMGYDSHDYYEPVT